MSRHGPIARTSPALAGVAAVALALGWAEAHPARPILELIGPSTFECGPMPLGTFGRHSWVIGNVGATPLRLRTRFTSGRSGFSLWQGRGHVIPPGRRIIVHLSWPVPSHPSRPFEEQATIASNDPSRTEIRLRVVGISRSAP